MVLSLLQKVLKPIFGSFEREELKKFLRMGLIFAIIIGSYWTMRALKKAVFFKLADATQIPYAKTASILFLLPIVIIYNRLLDRYPREKMFYRITLLYGGLLILFAGAFFLIQASPEVIAQRTGLEKFGTTFLGYAWYVFVESFGSLVVALFWALATDVTNQDSAKKGFSLIVALGNVGGIILPLTFALLPSLFNVVNDSPQVLFCGIFVTMLFFAMRWFLKATPKHLLINPFHVAEEAADEKEVEPGFFEGLKILFSSTYLLGIFAALAFFEIIATIFDYNFDLVVQATFGKGPELSAYQASVASSVTGVTLICLLLGVSNITRYLGVRVALALVPLIMGGAIVGFLSYDHLQFFFWLVVSAKAINYALNGPALKQLYIPISQDARFKAQAWIETFGSRGAKEAGSIVNMIATPLRSGILGLAIVALWFFNALFLGKTYEKAIKDKKLVC